MQEINFTRQLARIENVDRVTPRLWSTDGCTSSSKGLTYLCVYLEILDEGCPYKGVTFNSPTLPQEQFRAFLRVLCNIFDAQDVERLKGREVYALRCWNNWTADVEGLESAETGKRMTLTAFRREHVDPATPSPYRTRKLRLAHHQETLENRLVSLKASLDELKLVREHLEDLYTHWEPR